MSSIQESVLPELWFS